MGKKKRKLPGSSRGAASDPHFRKKAIWGSRARKGKK